MSSGTIFDIKRYAINDGPGIRTAIFFKGCPLECWWCHNPEGQNTQPQLMFRANRCKLSQACVGVCPQGAISWDNGPVIDWQKCDQCGRCAEACYAGALEMIGRTVTPDQVMAEIERDILFYDQSGGGVTFSGGEPMLQAEFLREILFLCKQQHIHTAVDTSGHTSWESFRAILPLVDLFLYDLKHLDDSRHKKYTSASNKLILTNLQKLAEAGAHVIVRIPLIPGLNDDPRDIKAYASFLAAFEQIEEAEIMPYHDIHTAKYEALGMEYRLKNLQPPTSEQVARVEQIFSDHGVVMIKHQGRAVCP